MEYSARRSFVLKETIEPQCHMLNHFPVLPSVLQASQLTCEKRKASLNDIPNISPETVVKPKRPLTAYNIFFRTERDKMVGVHKGRENDSKRGRKRPHRKSHGKVGFKDLAKQIGRKWKDLDNTARSFYQEEAAKDLRRYRRDMEVYQQTLHVIGRNNAKISNTCVGPQQKTKRLKKKQQTSAGTMSLHNHVSDSQSYIRFDTSSEVPANLMGKIDEQDFDQTQQFENQIEPLSNLSADFESNLRSALDDEVISWLCNLEKKSTQLPACKPEPTQPSTLYRMSPASYSNKSLFDVAEIDDMAPCSTTASASGTDWIDDLELFVKLMDDQEQTPNPVRRVRRRMNVCSNGGTAICF